MLNAVCPPPLTRSVVLNSEVGMYCPKCGVEMENVNGTLTCVLGEMPWPRLFRTTWLSIFQFTIPAPLTLVWGLN